MFPFRATPFKLTSLQLASASASIVDASLVERVTLAQKCFREWAVPIPPLIDQERIVAEAERRFSVIDEVEVQTETSLMRQASHVKLHAEYAPHNHALIGKWCPIGFRVTHQSAITAKLWAWSAVRFLILAHLAWRTYNYFPDDVGPPYKRNTPVRFTKAPLAHVPSLAVRLSKWNPGGWN